MATECEDQHRLCPAAENLGETCLAFKIPSAFEGLSSLRWGGESEKDFGSMEHVFQKGQFHKGLPRQRIHFHVLSQTNTQV